MPKEVMGAFQKMASDRLDGEASVGYVESLIRQNRYQQETWS